MSKQQDWRKEAQKRYKERLSGGKRFTLSEGSNSIRVLPRKNSNGSFGGYPYQEYRKHYNVGPDEKTVTCGKDIKGEGQCWLCDVQLPKLLKSDKREARARAAAMSGKDCFAVQVAYLDEANELQGPVLWEAPQRVANDLMPWLFSTRRDFTSFSKGYNFTIERTGTKKKTTRYGSVRPDEDPTPVPKSIVDKMKPFEELIYEYDPKRQQAAYIGRDIEELTEPESLEEPELSEDTNVEGSEPQFEDFQEDREPLEDGSEDQENAGFEEAGEPAVEETPDDFLNDESFIDDEPPNGLDLDEPPKRPQPQQKPQPQQQRKTQQPSQQQRKTQQTNKNTPVNKEKRRK